MRLREAYINAGEWQTDASIAKAKAWDLGRVWFEWDDVDATTVSLAYCRAKGVGVGLKMNGASGAVATAMDKALSDHGFGRLTSPASCGAAFDPEPFHPADVSELLHAWRSLRPTRWTELWIPPWQGGIFTPELVAAINADANLLVIPSLYVEYAGDQLYPSAFQALDELVAVGVSRAKLAAFLPVKSYAGVGVEIPYGWSGVLWTFDALPAAPPAPL